MSVAPIEILLWFVPLAVFGYALWRNRPSVDRFAAAHGLDLDDDARRAVRAALVRTRRGRVVGATVGALVAVVLVVGFDSRAPAIVALGTVLVGTLLGIGIAQFPSATSSDRVRTASLTVRDPAGYRPRRAAAIAVGLLLATAGYGVAVVAFADHGTAAVAAALVVILAVDVVVVATAARIARRVVEQARVQSYDRRVDDALRATTVRALHCAVTGVLLCGIAITGFVGVESQMFKGVLVGDRVAFRFPAGASFDGTTDVRIQSGVATVTWRDAHGHPRSTALATPQGASVTVGLLAGNAAFVAVGAWLATIGVLGALFEWGRASKAWRRPSPAARTEPVGSTT